MGKMTIFVLVTGAWFVVAGALGVFLSRKGRPYNLAITIIHGTLSLFIAAGVLSCIFQLQLIPDGKLFLSISICLLGTAACVKVISGIFVAFIKNGSPQAILFHKIGTYLMIVSLIAGFIFSVVKV
jgi:uncharacterized membrane protein